MKKDTLFADAKAPNAFSFDEKVAEVFPDMINRSVPGYSLIINKLPDILAPHITQHSKVYDIGCALGATSLSIAQAFNALALEITAMDYSNAMVEKARQLLSAYKSSSHIKIQQADITKEALTPCDAAVMNFTLQFIPRNQRQAVVNKIYQALNPGGILVLSEKLRFSNPTVDNKLIELHHQFKRENGYSDLEISQKRSSLENVMIIDSLEEQFARLQNAGFKTYSLWFQYFNFASIFAIKE